VSQIIDQAVGEADKTLSDPTLTPQGRALALIRKKAELKFPTAQAENAFAQLAQRFTDQVAEACSKFEYFAIPKLMGQFERAAQDLTIPPPQESPADVVKSWMTDIRRWMGRSDPEVIDALVDAVGKGKRIVAIDERGAHFQDGTVSSFEALRASRQPGWMKGARQRRQEIPGQY
jgi:hypothetical protein